MLKTLLLHELNRAGYTRASYDETSGRLTPTPDYPSIKYFQEGYTYRISDSPATKELARG